MDQTGLNFFQAIGFFANIFDLLNPNVTTTKQSDRLLATRISIRISALRFWMA
jgi:hypothetical protein